MQREWRVGGLRDSFGQVPYAQDAVDVAVREHSLGRGQEKRSG
jgi:hypothetical protein